MLSHLVRMQPSEQLEEFHQEPHVSLLARLYARLVAWNKGRRTQKL